MERDFGSPVIGWDSPSPVIGRDFDSPAPGWVVDGRFMLTLLLVRTGDQRPQIDNGRPGAGWLRHKLRIRGAIIIAVMRLHVLSDLRIEQQPFEAAEVEADVVVLAGDIDRGARGVEWAAQRARGRPV